MVKEKLAGIRVKKVGIRGNGINPTPKEYQNDKTASIPFRILNLEETVKECAIALVWLCRERERGEDLVIQLKRIEEGTKLSYRSVKKVLDLLEAEGFISVTELDYKNKKVELLF